MLKILFLFICITGFSQTKVGTIDVDYILSNMPELIGLQTEMQTYGKSLDADLTKKLNEYENLVKAYKETESNLSEDQKNTKRQTLISLNDEIDEFQKNATNLVSFKRSELLKPLYKKIGDALDTTAKSSGYTQILQIDESIVYLDQAYDITEAVLKELGIKISTN